MKGREAASLEDRDLASEIELLRESTLFDANWYVQMYPDVAMAGLDGLEHYLLYGADLDRNPGPGFDTVQYRREHPELLASSENPLVHFLRFSQRARASAVTGASRSKTRDENFRGYLDLLDDQGLAGWAVDAGNPGQAVELSVFADGEHLLDLTTTEVRADLAREQLDGSRAGFVYSWPSSLFTKGTSIDVRFKHSGWSLKKSPKYLVNRPSSLHGARSLTFDAFVQKQMAPVTIVIPVFNAAEAVLECLTSLAAHLPEYAEVLLIDDASTDPLIRTLLASHAQAPRVRLLTNESNLGYTRTVNKGVSAAADRDVVLLNSDTVVSARWLDALRYCAYSMARVATVTALSNNAGAFSVPVIGRHNPCPPHLNADEFARVATRATAGQPIDVPTGNGFCMYMRRDALLALGAFDEEKYPRGYGEENDYCMRAGRHGWRNLVSDKSLVFHKRSQSFQGEKDTLIRAGRRQLDVDYPEYGLLTARFRDFQFVHLRRRIASALQSVRARVLPRVLYVISTTTGGTPQTNLDLMRAVEDRLDCWLLRCDSRTLTLSELVDGVLVERESHPLEEWVEPVTHKSDAYDQVVAGILYRRGIELLHIRHIAWHSLNLSAIARSQNIPVVYSLHDFYSICPSLNLLDNNLNYCGGFCTPGDGECTKSLWPDSSLPTLKHRFVHRWQDMFEEFITSCDAFITTAPSAAETIERRYPMLTGKVQVIPHGRDFGAPGMYARAPDSVAKIKVLVPGNIGPAKGSELIGRIIELDVAGRFEFNFLGHTAGTLRGVGVHHGRYQRTEFQRKVREIAPTLGVVFSIWPETYCHTLTEMWSCGVPVLGMDIGAVGDRIRASDAGWLVAHDASPEHIMERLHALADDAAGFESRLQAVRAWQATESRWNDTATMAFQYRRVYRSLLGRDANASKRLGLLYRQKPYVPATAFIRVVNPWRSALTGSRHDARAVDAEWLLAGGTERIDALVIQRDAVPAAMAQDLVARLAADGIPYLYEIDDPLWELSDGHPDGPQYAEQRAAIATLAGGAKMVTTSTPVLAKRLAALNPRVEVVPNEADRHLWLSPLVPDEVMRVLAESGLDGPPRPRVLYMGTRSHHQDLEMIQPALAAVLAARPEVEFIQIGGSEALPGASRILVPSSCAPYPAFVRWFRSICTAATIAIAPIEDNAFNAAKSDMKALDYAMAGLPCVFSAVGPYKASVTHGVTGLLARSEMSVWILMMSKLLDDAALRNRIIEESTAWAQARSGMATSIFAGLTEEAFGWHLRE